MSDTYKLIDSGNFEKLEQIGPYLFVRPSPQAVWRPKLTKDVWQKVDARFNRYSGGDGKWVIYNKQLAENWTITLADIKLGLKRTDFGHLGIFAEQAANWQQIRKLSSSGMDVLNLFGYTGGSTLAAALGGASVVHLDASKTSVAWARDNAALNQLEDHPIRWIVDDARKFVARELKRGRKYHGVILDPPSFGRGSKNELWKIEEHLPLLLDDIKKILHDDFRYLLLSSHSPGYTPMAMKNNLGEILKGHKGEYLLEEMVIPEQDGDRVLPSGASVFFTRT